MDIYSFVAGVVVGLIGGLAIGWHRRTQLKYLFQETLAGLRDDSVLLPSLVRWADHVQHARDSDLDQYLRTKKHPARKTADRIKEVKAEVRALKRERDIALNRVDFYESLAPWLVEYTEFSVNDLIEALYEDQKAKAVRDGEQQAQDPIARYLSPSDWSTLSISDRNQLALDRYCDPKRKRSPWAAGIQYERYVGYKYEEDGYAVKYQGALHGKEDLGIDLICENSEGIMVVQCKRLSRVKGIPVRENVISQVFGTAEFHRMTSGTSKPVTPVLVTSYELSDEARRFAKHLNVQVMEDFELKPYPMIKCNVSQSTGEKIYHLPMDQRYDNVIVGDVKGEFYAANVAEAERAGFRRAYRWRGPEGN